MISKKESRSLGVSKGDNIWFFILHNLISMFFFFSFAVAWGLFTSITTFRELLSIQFGGYFMITLVASIISSILGWLFAFITLRLVKKHIFHKQPRSWNSISRGLNRFPVFSISFYISTLLSTIIFVIGATGLLAEFFFNELTLLTLMGAYLILKLSIYAVTTMILETKLS